METFTWKPFYVETLTTGYTVLISQFESGKEQRRLKHRKPREWNLSFRCSYQDLQNMRAFYDARQGAYEAFYWWNEWENPKERVTVRFDDNAVEWGTSFRRNGTVNIKLVEVL